MSWTTWRVPWAMCPITPFKEFIWLMGHQRICTSTRIQRQHENLTTGDSEPLPIRSLAEEWLRPRGLWISRRGFCMWRQRMRMVKILYCKWCWWRCSSIYFASLSIFNLVDQKFSKVTADLFISVGIYRLALNLRNTRLDKIELGFCPFLTLGNIYIKPHPLERKEK